MRVIGLDVHRSFAVAAAVEDTTVRQLGRIELTRERVLVFARRELRPDDEVVLEATGNTLAIVKLLAPLVTGQTHEISAINVQGVVSEGKCS
jgi:transposase